MRNEERSGQTRSVAVGETRVGEADLTVLEYGRDADPRLVDLVAYDCDLARLVG